MDPRAIESALNKAYPNENCQFYAKEVEVEQSIQFLYPKMRIKLEAYGKKPEDTQWFLDSLNDFQKRYQNQVKLIQHETFHIGNTVTMRATIEL